MLKQVLPEALDLLATLSAEGLPGEEALRRLAPLRALHPGIEVDLVWQEEPFTRSLHLQLLLRGEAGTATLSWCPRRAVPWVLREAHHARERDFLKIDGHVRKVGDVIGALDFIWEERRICDRLVDAFLLEIEGARHDLEVGLPELEAALDAFRARRGLWTAGAMVRWLGERGMEQAALERLLEAEIRYQKLQELLTGPLVESWFAAHAAELDTLSVARLGVKTRAEAEPLAERIRTGAVDFYAALAGSFLGGEAQDRAFAVLRRGALAPEVAGPLFAAALGDVVGPLPGGNRWELVKVLARQEARLDDAGTRKAVKDRLLEAWLAAAREKATISWMWGDDDGAILRPRGVACGT